MGFSDVNEYARGIAYFPNLAGGVTNLFPAGETVKIAGYIVSGTGARFIAIRDTGAVATVAVTQPAGEPPFVGSRGWESSDGLEVFVIVGAGDVDVTIFYFIDRE